MPEMQSQELYELIQVLLFVSGLPTEIQALARLLEVDDEQILESIESNKHEADTFLIQMNGEMLQLATHPRFSKYVQKWLQKEAKDELAPSAKETLAIIAYKQPITRPQIDELRGMDSRRIVQKLMKQGLIQHAEVPDDGDPRAYYYEVSLKFLEYFGLASMDELYSKVAQHVQD